MNTQGHPHAQLALQYWTAAATNAEEWKNWQYKRPDGKWSDCSYSPFFEAEYNYRRKPRTISINGYEVPEPLRKLPESGVVYVAEYGSCGEMGWQHSSDQSNPFLEVALASGLCHANEEAARIHLEAITSFTRQK